MDQTDNYKEASDNKRRQINSLNENNSAANTIDQTNKSVTQIHATDNKKVTHKLISNRQKRVPTSGSQYVINPGGNHTASGRINTRDIVPNTQKNDKELMHDLHMSNFTDTNDDIIQLLPPSANFKE